MTYRSPDHVVVRFAGPDAAAFLQSQLTNDVAALAVGGWQWQGYCSAKGRLLATFALLRAEAATFEAVTPVSTAAALVKRLSMYRLRSKLSIEAVPDRAVVFVDSGDAPTVTVEHALRLPDGRQIAIADASAAETLPLADEAARERWARANVRAALPEITAESSELFVPQMIGWDTVAPGGGVSFSKGCYPGQEIVARAHYRGAVKRHLEQATLAQSDTLRVGADVTLDDARIATICNLVPSGAGLDDRKLRVDALVVVASVDPN